MVQVQAAKPKLRTPFFNKTTKEMSSELWCPVGHDCVSSPLTCWNDSIDNITSNSWFSTNSIKPLTALASKSPTKTYLQALLQRRIDKELKEISNKEIGREVSQKNKRQRMHDARIKKSSQMEMVTTLDKDIYAVPVTPKKRKYSESIEKKTPNSTIRYRVYPSKKQHKVLQFWFKASRFIYNHVLHYLNSLSNEERKKSLNMKVLREKFYNGLSKKKVEDIDQKFRWLFSSQERRVPYSVLDQSVLSLIRNYYFNIAKTKTTGKMFMLHFKRWNCNMSMDIYSKDWKPKKKHIKKNELYVHAFNDFCFEGGKKRPDVLEYDARLVYTYTTGEYYLCVPRYVEPKSSPGCNPEVKAIAIDPGSRTFLTGFDMDGKVIEIGNGNNYVLQAVFNKRKKLISKLALMRRTEFPSKSAKKRYKRKQLFVKRAILRQTKRLQNLVLDCHKKVAKYLCSNYNIIVIPKLSFHDFSRSSKKTCASLFLFKHCSFVDRLVTSARLYKRCYIEICNEDFTTKTCSDCGILNNRIGSSKTFNCTAKCRIGNSFTGIDRDFNASKNILLKFLMTLV